MRSRETEVEVFGGEVESLTTAVRRGHRRARDRRPPPGLRVGRLARRRRSSTRRCRRRATTPRSASPTSGTRSRRPADANGVTSRRRSTSGATSSVAVPPTRRFAIALELDARPRPPTRASATWSRRATATRCAEAAIANSLGVEARAAPHDVLGVVGRDRRRRHRRADRLRLRRRPHARRSRSRLGSARCRRRARAGCSAPRRSRAGACRSSSIRS